MNDLEFWLLRWSNRCRLLVNARLTSSSSRSSFSRFSIVNNFVWSFLSRMSTLSIEFVKKSSIRCIWSFCAYSTQLATSNNGQIGNNPHFSTYLAHYPFFSYHLVVFALAARCEKGYVSTPIEWRGGTGPAAPMPSSLRPPPAIRINNFLN